MCGNQLVAADGQVEMTRLRGMLYEAAVPQGALDDAPPMPYATMAWERDADSLAAAESVDDFLALAAFKDLGVRVLDVRDADAAAVEHVQNALAALGYGAVPMPLLALDEVLPHAVVLDLAQPMLASLTEPEFRAVQRLTAAAKTLLWASAGGLLSGAGQISGNSVCGLKRRLAVDTLFGPVSLDIKAAHRRVLLGL